MIWQEKGTLFSPITGYNKPTSCLGVRIVLGLKLGVDTYPVIMIKLIEICKNEENFQYMQSRDAFHDFSKVVDEMLFRMLGMKYVVIGV